MSRSSWSARFALLGLALATACGAQSPAASAPAAPGARGASPTSRPSSDAPSPSDAIASVQAQANGWRAAHRLIDLHTHVDAQPGPMALAVRVMDGAGIGTAVNLSGGTVTHARGGVSAFEAGKAFTDARFPGRFLEYMNLDYAEWDSPDFAAKAVAQVEEGARLGAAGFKEFKRLGLFLRDKNDRLLKIDDPKLDPMWAALGRLGMPVSIHVADPKAFWSPNDATNERWKELKDHPRWWFGDPKVYPPREELLAALERVVSRHPETTFVCVHFGNNAEDLGWVDAQLDRHPNMMVDIAARVPEIGRRDATHETDGVRAFFAKHQDRILFATDFQSYERLTLGSGGNGPPPTEADALDFFAKHWRFFETADTDFAHMTPIQGDWTISAIHLPADALEKIYFGNADRLLAKAFAKLRASTGDGGT
jgi:predicted TIM-barrel fold metal-dependent hydrolase